jgi:hypothetical protein
MSSWCEQRLYGTPEIVNAFSSLALSGSAIALFYTRKDISILPILTVFLVGIASFSFHFWPTAITRLFDECSLLAYESLVLNYVVKHENAAAITIISLFCTLMTGRFNCFLLIIQAFAIFISLPNTFRFSSATIGYSTVALISWFMDFFICDQDFFITKWTRLTPHAIWHISGGFASYYATIDMFKHNK